MKNFPKKILSIFIIMGMILFFGVYSVIQYQSSYMTGYLGVEFPEETTQETEEETQEEENSVELSSEDREFFEDNIIQCLDTTPGSYSVCKFFMPLDKRISENTIQVKIGNNKSEDPSAYCQQDGYNTVMCGYVQTPPKKGVYAIELLIGDEEISTGSTVEILLPVEFQNKYRTQPQFSIQYAGGYIDNKNNLTGSRCQLYFEDIRANHPMCYKLTILRELNIFTGQTKEDRDLPYANLKAPIKRVEFFTLAYRFLKQTEFTEEKGDPYTLQSFDDLKLKTLIKPSNKWWTEPVAYLVENGIIKGYKDNTLKPLERITEAEMAKTLLYIKGYELEAEEGQKWYEPITEFYENRGFRLNPTKKATRQMAAELLHYSLGI